MADNFDLEGARILELFQNKDVEWINPPDPDWRIQPPSLLAYLFKGGFSIDDYNTRFERFIGAVMKAWPGSFITHTDEPKGIAGTWTRADTDPRMPMFWTIPADADVVAMRPWLARGGWSIWKPSKKPSVENFSGHDVPRYLAESCLKHSRARAYHYLLSSTWDNRFTYFAINPELFGAGEKAA